MQLIHLYLGGTSLILAATYGHTDTVTTLLKNGAKVNTKDNNGLLHNIIIIYFFLYIYKLIIFIGMLLTV